ncbi:MAG: hypothetical protein JST89_02755 [Cyanobacteria bacterium SZAS-4]|nr:hypothetical protein [Cyanobacteria bacterium SZAS-4]
MIECPICHVMNEEQAHFCSECGQRFAPAAPQPTFQNPNASAPDPVFPSFSPSDKSQFPQPQAVQDYQQSSNFNAPSTSPPPQDFGGQPQQPAFNAPQPAFNPPQTPAFNPPQPQSAPPSFDAPRQNFDAPQQPAFNPPQTPAFNPPQSANFNSPSETPSFNTPQDAQSKTFPPEPEAPSTPPLPARPKLHSPLFDGPDEPDSRPQAPKSVGGFGGLNKPKGLRSPLLGEDDSEAEPPKPRSGGLRSPLLRGEDDPDHPQRGKGSQRNQILPPDNDPPAPTSGKGKGGLRSPLLGASDDDFVPQPKPVKPPKGLPASRPASSSHLRSPLLGGVDDYEGDDDDDDLPPVPGKTAFPHRRPAKDNANAGAPESSDQTSSGRFPGKSGGLRSPLLGASDVDDLPSRPTGGGRQRLHSPIMDGPGGGSQNFDSDYDEPYYEEIDDPNVLRSPLLAARSKHVAPTPPTPPAPVEPPAPPPAKIVTPQAPPAQPPAAFPSTNSFSEPSAQPEFRDRGFPPAPQPPGDMWRERGFNDSRGPEPKAVTPTPIAPSSPPEVAPSIKESSPSPPLRRSSRSGLLGGASDDIDDQPINNYRNSPPPNPLPAMLLLICCIVSIPAKLWYMSIMSASMMANPGFLFEEVMQLLLLLALIFFAATAAKR